MVLDEWRTSYATRSRLAIPQMGTERDWAIAFAVAIPTRIPVKRPGPRLTATPPRLAYPRPDSFRQKPIAGNRNSLWPAPRDTIALAITPCSEPIATLA